MMSRTTSCVIRLARLADAGTIAEMSRALVEYGLAWRWRPPRIRQLISSREATVIIAESSNKVSGFAIVTFAPVSAHINLLAVNPVSRRSGVATAMIDWLVESCQVAGLGCIRLEVRAANLGAIKCYNKLGFESVGVTRGYYDRKEDAQHMVLTLISPETEKRRPA